MPRKVACKPKSQKIYYEELKPLSDCDEDFLESLECYTTYNDLKSALLLNHTHRVLMFEGNELKCVCSYTSGGKTMHIVWLVSTVENNGYGSVMVDYIKDLAKSKRFAEITLTPVGDRRIIQFYKNRGFIKHRADKMIYII
jgi:hypothetical protein